MTKFSALTAFALAFGLASPVAAGVSVVVEQNKVVTEKTPDGATIERVAPADSVVPGDVIEYRYVVSNTGAEPAENVALDTAVPENMVYIADSARNPGVDAKLSVDGGASYGDEATLMVFDVDETWRPARPEDITHLRWRLTTQVPPQSTASVAYRARLK